MEPLKIGLFTDDFFPHIGGTEMVVKNLAIALAAKADVRVVAQRYGGSRDEFPFPVDRCKSLNFNEFDATALPRLDPAFRKAVAAREFDVIHIHTPLAIGKLGIAEARRRGIPVVATFHTQFKYDVERRIKWPRLVDSIVRSMTRGSYERCDEVWTMYPDLFEVLRGYGYRRPEGFFQMTNACDIARVDDPSALRAAGGKKLGLDPAEKLIIAVGRLVEAKNYALTLRAVAAARAKGFRCRYLVVGEGAYRKDIEALVAELGIADAVTLYGQVRERSDLMELYARADLLAVPSLFDTFSLCMLEAAAVATPTITLREAIMANAITDGVNGYTAANDPAAFGDRLIEVLSDDAARARVGGAARDQLHRTWDQLADAVIARYRYLIDQGARKDLK